MCKESCKCGDKDSSEGIAEYKWIPLPFLDQSALKQVFKCIQTHQKQATDPLIKFGFLCLSCCVMFNKHASNQKTIRSIETSDSVTATWMMLSLVPSLQGAPQHSGRKGAKINVSAPFHHSRSELQTINPHDSKGNPGSPEKKITWNKHLKKANKFLSSDLHQGFKQTPCGPTYIEATADRGHSHGPDNVIPGETNSS